ncbi:DUF4333 domain-containing protein [Amycolatopsis roodepoortensis]|uniref:DUF4333 domain-containing protein n=1 Tax=Amycolatopsis roodepoortensis TaxID=700274 RepID=A0ABR9LA28_9PSEU|nr:DUF4333 domain-containing protein [Amycolatopsis roodepoortensis]MBE1577165.1 hypothetical protein [Amycolatopsis roodepoortensis]UUV32512.1 DUF4333 domain-containing protein [Amycolatopsis roodepoortensis]
MSRRAVSTVGLCCAAFAMLAACSDTPAPAPATKTVTVPPTTSASPSTSATSGGSSSAAPGRVFDPRTMQADVRKILTETYQVREVGDVLCPANQTVKDGSTFTCTVQVGGEGKTVTITVTGDDGRYEVGAPA